MTPEELAGGVTREGVARVTDRWLATRSMAPMGFLVRVEPFTFPSHRHCFVAERGGQVVGFAGVVPVPARRGWFLEDLVRDPTAPNGTSEMLVDAVMRWALAEGSTWLTLGFAPLAGDVARPLRAARSSTRLLYDFEGLRRYKAKLRPQHWSPIYLAYPAAQGAVLSLVDALAAFTRGGFFRFGLRSLVRGPMVVLRALTVLLVPWTLVLMLAPSEHWFGAAWVKWSWVVFDVLVAFSLFRLLHSPTLGLFSALAVAVTADASLTLLQALCWNCRGQRARSTTSSSRWHARRRRWPRSCCGAAGARSARAVKRFQARLSPGYRRSRHADNACPACLQCCPRARAPGVPVCATQVSPGDTRGRTPQSSVISKSVSWHSAC